MEAWIGLVGVALGAILGWIPQFVSRGDTRAQAKRADDRQKQDDTARREAHMTAALLKCAEETHEFLAAWELFVDAEKMTVENRDGNKQLDLLKRTHERAAKMKTAWSEAFVILPPSHPRRNVIRHMLDKAWDVPDREAELGELATTSELALRQLIGTEPMP
jgi:hypothetical protein